MPLQILFNGHGQYRPGDAVGPACWPHHDLILITRGSVRFSAAGCYFLLQDGDGLLIPPGNPFRGTPTSDEADVRAVHFTGYRPVLPGSPLSRRGRPCVATGLLRNPVMRDYSSRLLSLQAEATVAAGVERRAILSVLLVNLEQDLLQAPTHPVARERFDALLKWAEEEFRGGVPVAEMAARAGLSESHFRASFKAVYGITPATALRDIRLREARLLLRQTPYSIAEVSRMVGYGDVVAFHRAFRRHGETPADYRTRRRGKV